MSLSTCYNFYNVSPLLASVAKLDYK